MIRLVADCIKYDISHCLVTRFWFLMAPHDELVSGGRISGRTTQGEHGGSTQEGWNRTYDLPAVRGRFYRAASPAPETEKLQHFLPARITCEQRDALTFDPPPVFPLPQLLSLRPPTHRSRPPFILVPSSSERCLTSPSASLLSRQRRPEK